TDRVRKALRIVPDQDVFAVHRLQPFTADAGADHGLPHGPRGGDLQPRPAADPERNDGTERIAYPRPHVVDVARQLDAILGSIPGDLLRARAPDPAHRHPMAVAAQDREDLPAEVMERV